ncbi:MAG: nickel pincer cofactor biosynthesis protein LarB [Candidatus Krumholzibacteriota bacterium]|nr:nickel pincer cofactor biosynthesis protein LarB [Candidatus Krumholzibacteriota bacterium]
MKENDLKGLLERVAKGKISVSDALERLKVLPFEDINFARIDHHRELRRGFPEVIFCQGKRADQIVRIARGILESGANLLATRCSDKQFENISPSLPDAEYHHDAKLFTVRRVPVEKNGKVAIVSGGTSDMPVCEEAALSALFFGCAVDRFYDVGVAGIHRFISSLEEIRKADVIIVVAGMEGALASVVAGMISAPVIAVPTSIGYGASFDGLSALLTMLNSCAGGVSVVNIDNGYGAAFSAALICRGIYNKDKR